MRISLFLFLLISFSVSAQSQRFAYEYKFITDSTNLENPESELMYLDVTKEGSQFYSRAVFISDSLQNEELEKQKKMGSNNIHITTLSEGKIRYRISKMYPNFETIFNTRLGMDVYDVSDDRVIKWEIAPEKENISGFLAQKASTIIYGRKWITWFTDEIPIQDGPYKFHGLPGLIIKISDDSNTHSYELKGVAKFNNIEGNLSKFNDSKAIKIDHKDYKKLYLNLRNDPAKTLRQMISTGKIISFKDASGKEISVSEIIRKREKSTKENNLRNNNPIDLELLK